MRRAIFLLATLFATGCQGFLSQRYPQCPSCCCMEPSPENSPLPSSQKLTVPYMPPATYLPSTPEDVVWKASGPKRPHFLPIGGGGTTEAVPTTRFAWEPSKESLNQWIANRFSVPGKRPLFRSGDPFLTTSSVLIANNQNNIPTTTTTALKSELPVEPNLPSMLPDVRETEEPTKGGQASKPTLVGSVTKSETLSPALPAPGKTITESDRIASPSSTPLANQPISREEFENLSRQIQELREALLALQGPNSSPATTGGKK